MHESDGALVVTGAGRGIGAEIALRAAAAGMPVAIFYRTSAEGARNVVHGIEAKGGHGLAIQVDLQDEDSVVRAFEALDAEFDGLRGLVNNAVWTGQPTAPRDLHAAQIRAVLETNVVGSLLCIREAVRRLSTRYGGPGGAIVSISSARAVHTGGAEGWLPFAASKAAVETISRGLAIDLAADGIRVNVVRAGIVDTEMRRTQDENYVSRLIGQVPMKRIGTAADVARAVLWLLSADASYVTGATLDVTGGL